MSTTPPRKILRVRQDGKLVSPGVPTGAAKGGGHGQAHSAAQGQLRELAPPSKVMKVHSDGTLRLATVDAVNGSAKRRGRRKNPVKEEGVPLRCVVVMHYGANEESRMAIGRRVDEILQRNGSTPNVRSTTPLKPPRTTHPFFTGKLSQTAGQRLELISKSEEHDSQVSLGKQNCGPRQSRVTSKPPGISETAVSTAAPNLPSFGADFAKTTRFPGARDPIWPPSDMLHIGQCSHELTGCGRPPTGTATFVRGRKLKNVQTHVSPEEDILNGLASSVRRYSISDDLRDLTSRNTRNFRRPRRQIMTGHALQQTIRSRVNSMLPSRLPSSSQQQEESKLTTHQALLSVYNGIEQSRTAFDLFQYETQEWAHKYCPKTAEDVLQQGREALLLRDWLQKSTVASVEPKAGSSRTRDSAIRKRGGPRIAPKNKRKAKALDGFVVSSDEEADEMDEIARSESSSPGSSQTKKSVMRVDALHGGERNGNAVVISGPHGCGKTAAVFAVAKELGFEVFEVNAGSRRSGKDILDKVGDMTRNHLVKHRHAEHALGATAQPLGPDNEVDELSMDLDGDQKRQAQLIFPPKSVNNTRHPREASKANVTHGASRRGRESVKKAVLQDNNPNAQDQKQSLILLEEVDVLFEEDKLFWATVIDLVMASRRPVIMTCSDETFLPLDELTLYAILRFTSTPEPLATDYLMLVAASEGHILPRDAIKRLYVAKGLDLRATLAELNLHCQMGVGDNKGGLEWMLIDKPIGADVTDSRSSRVTSENTYCDGMGWLGGEDVSHQSCETLDDVIDLCAEVWDDWGLDIGATDILAPSKQSQVSASGQYDAWSSLQRLDRWCEAYSAADVFPGPVTRQDGSSNLDLEQPALTDKSRCNYIDGQTLLQAEPLVDYSSTIQSAAMALRACGTILGTDYTNSVVRVREALDVIPRLINDKQTPSQLSKVQVWAAFQTMAESSSLLGDPKGLMPSAATGSISSVTTEVAPYIRAIVSYDLRLEERRCQLNTLLAQSASVNKKFRTTRASLAALEGGSKAETRRKRWFPDNINFNAILETGGKDWQELALQALPSQVEGGYREEPELEGSPLAESSDRGT